MIDWNDNAKAAVDYFADWLRANYNYIANLEDFYSRLPQTKTVADAVEHCNGVWPEDEPDDFVCVWNNKGGRFEFWCEGYAPVGYCHQVCTRAEFEAYLAGVEPVGVDIDKDALKAQYKSAVKGQEDEKWTHTDTDGEPCKILIDEPDTLGRVLILRKNGWYVPIDRDSLKPIKPTISESELMERIKSRAISIDYDDAFGAKVRSWIDKYDII